MRFKLSDPFFPQPLWHYARIAMVYAATLGPIGYLPASGTIATVITYLFFCVVTLLFGMQEQLLEWWFVLPWWFIFVSGCSYVVTVAYRYIPGRDPHEIVLDEIMGTATALLLMPLWSMEACIALCLFRFLDITKIWPVFHFEAFPGAAGVIADDIAAALVARLCIAGTHFIGWL